MLDTLHVLFTVGYLAACAGLAGLVAHRVLR